MVTFLNKIKNDPIEAAFGAWRYKLKEDGITYVDKLRATWEKARVPSNKSQKYYDMIPEIKLLTPY